MILDASRDRIRALRLRGRALDPLAARRTLERALAPIGMRMHGAPAEAIVCLRHVRVRAPERDLQRWHVALAHRMRLQIDGISRPFSETVSEGATGVMFESVPRLLACLLRDWRRNLGGAWWWRGLFGTVADTALVQRVLTESAMYVPAALIETGPDEATELVRALPTEFCERLGAAIAGAFAVPGWSSDAHPPAHPADRRSARSDTVPTDAAPRATPITAMLTELAERASLAPVQRALLGMSLLLYIAPALARLSGVVAGMREPPAPDEVPPPSSRPAIARRSPVPMSSSRDPDRTFADPAGGGAVVQVGEDAGRSSSGTVDGPPESPHQPDVFAPMTDSRPALEPDRAGAPAATILSDAETARCCSAGVTVDSRVAGVIYLVNLAIHLDLYADFTRPGSRGLAIPLGEFLARVGRRACGEEYCDDPLWALLAHLGATPPRETQPIASPPDRASDEASDEWNADVSERLEARAAPALGLPPGDALAFLCRRPGMVSLTLTRLDVAFALAAHPLAIRLAGLDRNPGWVPAAGRIIELHYE